MNNHESAAGRPRRIVRKIVLTYTVEGDPEQKEQTMTLTRESQGKAVDGIVWSRSLMDRLAYLRGAGSQGCEAVQRRPARGDDGWQQNGKPPRDGASLTAASDPSRGECIWLHEESCTWIAWCDPEAE
jgi:hypothetical protein